jgi:hypothetical protein
MRRSHREERFADDLQEVADVLSERRPTLDPLALDRVKLRAMSAARRSTSSREKGSFMRSRLTTLLVAAFLTLGTGGALALAGGDGGGNSGGSASFHQYRCEHSKGHAHGCEEGKEEEKGGKGKGKGH